MPEQNWTYKTLKFGRNQRAEWVTADFWFPTVEEAIGAATAFMAAGAARGEMRVVSLEPSREYKPVAERLIEHHIMLDELKRRFADPNGGEVYLWNMIHMIDPEWPNPWRQRAEDAGMVDGA